MDTIRAARETLPLRTLLQLKVRLSLFGDQTSDLASGTQRLRVRAD